jgi:DNA-binding transcriptional ArsR family regulator
MKSKGNIKPLIDQKLVSALSHPLRVHILDTISEGTASPSDLAREVGVDVNYVAYHFKELEKLGYVELADTQQRRGAVEHYYRAKAKVFLEDPEWERVPLQLKRGFTADLLQMIATDLREALETGSFHARASHLSRTRLLVDEDGWNEVTVVLREALEQVLTIQAECGERLKGTDEEAIPVAVSIAGFEIPPRGGQSAGELPPHD